MQEKLKLINIKWELKEEDVEDFGMDYDAPTLYTDLEKILVEEVEDEYSPFKIISYELIGLKECVERYKQSWIINEDDFLDNFAFRGQVNLNLYSPQIKLVEKAIKEGADPNSRARGYDYPLHHAVGFSRYAIANILIKNGANINSIGIRGLSPLHDAIINGNYKMVKLLIENKADTNICNNDGTTALEIARNECDYNRNKIISLLLKNGAK